MSLIVSEIFGSIQGEGIHTGLMTTFVRLAGCDLRCRWCDTKYALDRGSGKEMTVEDIVQEVGSFGHRLVCLTGGEPLLQDGAADLIERLQGEGYNVDLETNGSKDISFISSMDRRPMISIDVKTPSSGESESFLLTNLDHLKPNDQMKFIITDQADIGFFYDFISMYKPDCNIILTPCSNRDGANIVDTLLNGYRTSDESIRCVLEKTRVMVQTHKVIWENDQRSV